MLDYIDVKYFKRICNNIGKETANDISARCVVCGDSAKDKSKKRLHLYTKSGWDGASVHCFNCDYSATVFRFIKEYGDGNDYIEYLKERGIFKKKEEPVLKITSKKKGLQTFKKPENLLSVRESLDGAKYLRKRGVLPKNVYFTKGEKLLDIEFNFKDFIVIPLLTKNDEWYGFYSRSIRNKIFYTYIPDGNDGYKVWNFYKIDKTKPVYIFEGIFDAISSGKENAIATMGADINEDRLKELSKPIFCFDNDDTGIKKSLKYLKLGYDVLDWHGETYKDMNERLLAGYSKEDNSNFIDASIVSNIVGLIKLTTPIKPPKIGA